MFTPRAAGRMEDAGQIAGNYPKVEKGVKGTEHLSQTQTS